MKKIHYGWLICAACFLQLFVTGGIPCTAFGVHLPFIISESGFTNAQGSAIVAVRTIAILLTTLLVARFYEKVSLRRGMLYAALLGAAGFVAYGCSATTMGYYIGAVLTGMCNGLGGIVPVSLLIGKWFHQKRGFALGVASIGTGAATIILPPLVSALVLWAGLKQTFWVEAAFTLLAGGVVFAVLRNSPAEINACPYGILEPVKTEGVRGERSGNGCLSRRQEWLVLIALCLLGGGNVISFLTLLYVDVGYTESMAAAIFSLVGVVLTVGKAAVGHLADRIGLKWANYLAYALLVFGTGISCLLGTHNAILLGGSVLCLGIGMTATTIGISYLAEDFSTEKTFGKTLEKYQAAYLLGVIISSYMVGIIADLAGGYVMAFLVCTIIELISFVCVWAVYRGRKVLRLE